MIWYEDEVRALEQALAANPPPPQPVVFYGSSSIRLWETLADDFADVRPLNLGFGGSTLAACVHFFERLVTPHQPRALIFYAGDNDLGDGQRPAAVCADFDALLAKVDQQLGSIPFAFMAIKPSPARWLLRDAIRHVNLHARRQLAERPDSHFIDVYSPMLDANGRPRRELFAADGLHLTPAGYRLWAQIVAAQCSQIF